MSRRARGERVGEIQYRDRGRRSTFLQFHLSWDRAQTQGRVAVNSCWILGCVTEALELLYQEENLAPVLIWGPEQRLKPLAGSSPLVLLQHPHPFQTRHTRSLLTKH